LTVVSLCPICRTPLKGRQTVACSTAHRAQGWRRQQAGEWEGTRAALLLLRAQVDDLLARVNRQRNRRRRRARVTRDDLLALLVGVLLGLVVIWASGPW
jgi:hypothetical protein